MFQNEGDRFTKIGKAFLACFSLTISSGNLGAICYVPVAVSFHYRSEFVAHQLFCNPYITGPIRHGTNSLCPNRSAQV